MIVWMKHPRLPESQLIEIPEGAVEGHRRSGWQVTDPPPPEPTAVDLEAAHIPDGTQAAPEPELAAPVGGRPDESPTAPDGKE